MTLNIRMREKAKNPFLHPILNNDECILYLTELSYKFPFFYLKLFTILYVFYIYEAMYTICMRLRINVYTVYHIICDDQ